MILKIKYFLSFIFLNFLCQSMLGQNVSYFQKDGKIGLKDYTNNKIIIPAEFDYMNKMTNSSKSVRGNFYITIKNNLSGIVSGNGQVVLSNVYDEVDFNVKYGYYFFAKKNDEWHAIDTSGSILFKSKDPIQINSKFFYINNQVEKYIVLFDYKGNKIVKYNEYTLAQFNDEESLLIIRDKDNSKFVADLNGNIILGNDYKHKYRNYDISFENSYIIVRPQARSNSRGLSVLHNQSGEVLFQDTCEIKVYHKNLIKVEYSSEKWVWLNGELNPFFPNQDSTKNLTLKYSEFRDYIIFKGVVDGKSFMKAYLVNGTPVFQAGFNQLITLAYGYLLYKNNNVLLVDSLGNIKKTLPFSHVIYTGENFRSKDGSAVYTPYTIGEDEIYSYVFDLRDGNVLLKSNKKIYRYKNVCVANDKITTLVSISDGVNVGLMDLKGNLLIPLDKVWITVSDRIEVCGKDRLTTYFTLGLNPMYAGRSINSFNSKIIDGVLLIEDHANNEYWFYHPDSLMPWLKAKSYHFVGKCYVVASQDNLNFGLYSIAGEPILPNVYTSISFISNKYFSVIKEGRVGVVDANNKVAIPLSYKTIFPESFSSYKTHLLSFGREDGKKDFYWYDKDILIPVFEKGEYDQLRFLTKNKQGVRYYVFTQEKKMGLVTIDKVIYPAIFNNINQWGDSLIQFYYNDSICLAMIENPSILSSYFDDSKGVPVLDTKRHYVYVIKKQKMGLMDYKLNMILPLQYKNISYVKNDFFVVQNEMKMYALLVNAKWRTPFNIDSYEIFKKNGFYEIKYKQNNFYYLYANVDNKIAGPFNEVFVKDLYKYETFIVTNLEGRFGLIDNKTGKPVLDNKYDKLEILNNNSVVVKYQNKVGLFDLHGITKLPLQFDSISMLYRTNNYYLVKANNKWGLYDTSGTVILPCEYDDIFNTGEYLMRENKMSQLESGNKIKSFYLTATMEKNCTLKKDFFIVVKNGKYGIVNTQNAFLYPCVYDLIYDDDEGYIIRLNNKDGYLNHKTEIVIPIQYEWLDKIEETDKYYVSLNDKIGVMDQKGRMIISALYDEIIFKDNSKCYLASIGDSLGVIDSIGGILIPVIYSDIKMYKTHCFVYNKEDLIAIYSFRLKKFISGFVYNSYEEHNWGRNQEYFIMMKNGNNIPMYGVYMPDDDDSPLQPKYEKLKVNYEDDSIKLYYRNKGKWYYKVYSSRYALSNSILVD